MRRARHFPCLLPVLLFTVGCAAAADTSRVLLVETTPIETALDDPERPNAADVWPVLIDGATSHIDWAAFYVSDREEENPRPSRLTAVLDALTRAVERGVRVRVLAAESFYRTYPQWLDALDAGGAHVRLIDFDDGVMHAKYFVIDGRSAYVGSQNTDWRALEHIYEMGMWTDDADATDALADAFSADYALAADIGEGEPHESAIAAAETLPSIPAEWPVRSVADDAVRAVMSPEPRLPSDATWDLGALLRLLNGAERSLRLSLLTFYTSVRGSDETWPVLSDALVAAGSRGVDVDILLADWCKRESSIGAVKRLQHAPGVDVKFVTFPEASEGFIPYARCNHAKYLIVDGERFWLGTSNWSKGYFFAGRNVGLRVDDAAVALELAASFTSIWASDYAELVDPAREYEPPRIGE